MTDPFFEAQFARALRWMFQRGACWRCAVGACVDAVEGRSPEMHERCALVVLGVLP